MAQATAAEAPSHVTRKVIVQVTDRGIELEREVDAFAIHAHEAKEAFDSEFVPLHLPDERYELVAAASGLAGLFGLVERMRETLGGVTAA